MYQRHNFKLCVQLWLHPFTFSKLEEILGTDLEVNVFF